MVQEDDLSAAAANRMWAYLRAILICARDEWGEDVPTIRLKALKENPGRVRFLEPEEETRLLDACSPALRPLVTVLLDSGMRRGEAMSLKWSDVEWTNDRAILRIRAGETKTAKSRRVPLTRRATEALRVLRDNRPKGHVHVFVLPARTKHNELRVGANPRTGFEAACRRAEIEDFRMHDTRHCYASKLAQRGASLQQIKELLGHSSIKMVLRYAHLIPSNLDEAVSLLDVA
jgi:integrase